LIHIEDQLFNQRFGRQCTFLAVLNDVIYRFE